MNDDVLTGHRSSLDLARTDSRLAVLALREDKYLVTSRSLAKGAHGDRDDLAHGTNGDPNPHG